MDPLTALSIAANVVQFTDFSLKLFKNSQELANSAEGALSCHQELTTAARDLLHLRQRILDSRISSTGNDATIDKITDECMKLALSLTEVLDRVKCHHTHKNRKWATLYQALKGMTKAGEIEDLTRRLLNVRGQLQTHILVDINAKIDILALQQSQMFQTLDATTHSLIVTMVKDRELANLETTRCMEAGNNAIREDIAEVRNDILSAVRNLDSREWNLTTESTRELDHNLAAISKVQERRNVFKSHIIKSLSFDAMEDRESNILPAHESTFRWIYKPAVEKQATWSDFVRWLSEGSGIYWVQGKPGSGKSCLMKYIHQNQETERLLRQWAEDRPLVTAAFYFWYAGTTVQKSYSGLIRQLLSQILDQQPLLMPIAFPEAWEQFNKDPIPDPSPLPLNLTHGNLLQALNRTLSQNVFAMKTCILVDGLDEFDGDHVEMTTFLKTIVETSSSIKICVSSRPWVVFKNGFARYPGLKLQELTSGDITNYIEETLDGNTKMVELRNHEPIECSSLIREIVERASGVFLWVTLVVKSLLAGLMNNDQIFDLKIRLEELPSDLEDLYIYMLTRIEPCYLQQAAKLFSIVQHAYSPLPSLLCSIADEYEPSGLPSSVEIRLMEEAEKELRCTRLEDKVQSRCLGLIECQGKKSLQPHASHMARATYGISNTTVQYMHRTVRDFFSKPMLWYQLQKYQPELNITYNANTALCFSSLVKLKQISFHVPYGYSANALVAFEDTAREILGYACAAEQHARANVTTLLDDLEQTAVVFFEKHQIKDSDMWTGIVPLPLAGCCPESDGNTRFLALSMYYGINDYVCEKVQTMSLQGTSLDYLLNLAIELNLRSPRIIRTLLSTGADPNRKLKGFVPWHNFVQRNLVLPLDAKVCRIPKTYIQDWAQDVLESFVSSNADNYIEIQVGYSELLALDLIIQAGNARVVNIVLERGANPNFAHQGSTVWEKCLSYAYQELPRWFDITGEDGTATIKDWLDKFSALLQYGANPRAVAFVPNGVHGTDDRCVSVLTVINEVFIRWDIEGALLLKQTLPKDLQIQIHQTPGRRNNKSLDLLRSGDNSPKSSTKKGKTGKMRSIRGILSGSRK